MILYEKNSLGIPNFYSIFPSRNISWPLHLHLNYECISIKSGIVEVTVNHTAYCLNPGDTTFIIPNQLHSLHSLTASEVIILHFSTDLIHYFTSCYQGLYPQNPVLFNVPVTIEKFKTDNIFRQKALLYELCGKLTESTDFSRLSFSNSDSHTISQIFQYVEGHFKEECNLKKLSEELGYSYAYLSRAFKRISHLSFTEYLNQYRIHHACLLLQNSNYSVSDIAYQCGYDSLRSFNRNFQSIIKMSPRQWREESTVI